VSKSSASSTSDVKGVLPAGWALGCLGCLGAFPLASAEPSAFFSAACSVGLGWAAGFSSFLGGFYRCDHR
jgi:hypothetical protein